MKKFLIVFVLLIFGSVLFSQTISAKIDSLKNELKKNPEKKEQAELNYELASNYVYIDPNSGITYAEQGLKLSKELKLTDKICSFNNILGLSYFYLSKYTEATTYFKKSLIQAKQNGDDVSIVNATVNLGMVYYYSKFYDIALDILIEGVELAKTQKLTNQYSIGLSLMASVYLELKKYDRVLEIYDEVLELNLNSNNTTGLAGVYNDYGITYKRMKKYNQALEYFNKALVLANKDGNLQFKKNIVHNLGTISMLTGKNKKAIQYFNDALVIDKKFGDTESVVLTYISLCKTHISIAEFSKAESYLKSATGLVKENDLNSILPELYETHSEFYLATKNYKKAYEFLKKTNVLKNSLLSEESEKRLADLQVHYETHKKEDKIELLLLEKRTQTKVRNNLIIIIGLIFLLLAVLFFAGRHQKKIIRLLKENRTKFQDMFEKNSAVMFILDPDNTKIVEFNKSAQEFYGIADSADMRTNLFDICTTEKKKITEQVQKWIEGHNEPIIAKHKIYTGKFRNVKMFSTPIVSEGKTFMYFIVQDITEQLKFEDKLKELNITLGKRVKEEVEIVEKQQKLLIQKSKMESLGKLASGIAHEINQPLGALTMGLDNIFLKLSQENCSSDYLTKKQEIIKRNLRRIGNIIQQVRTYSRSQEFFKMEEIDVNRTVEDSISMLQTQYKNHNIHLKTEYGNDIGFTIGSKQKLEQVILNLLSNSKFAVEEKYDKFLNKTQESTYKKEISVRSFSEGSKLIIEVKDTGTGIPENVLSKIFDPFYTTKDIENGTGLGLSISLGIIQEMDGNIEFFSKTGEYTTARIILKKFKKR